MKKSYRFNRLFRDSSKSPRKFPASPISFETLEDRTLMTVVFNPQYGAETLNIGPGVPLSSAPIYLLFWGAGWENAQNAPLVSSIEHSVQTLFPGSPGFLGGITQYGSDGKAHLAGVGF